MNDKELLELAAKAAGMHIVGEVDRMVAQPGHLSGGFVTRNERGGDSLWNPFTDDGDALRLAVKLHINIDVQETSAWHRRTDNTLIQEYWSGDYDPSYRRAIVRAAAEIGKGMK